MEDNVKISIVLASYQCESYIQKAIDSLINQTFPHPYEIIIVDDGSNDLTIPLINKYLKIYPFIHLYNVSFHDVAKVRQYGIEKAKGEYTCFLDGDDYYHKNMLQVMYNTAIKKEADVVNCSLYYVRKNRISINPFSLGKTMNRYSAIEALFFDCFLHGFVHTKIYKTSLLKEVVNNIEYPNESFVYEDYLTNYFIFKKCNKVISITKPLIYYNKNNANSITKMNLNRSQDFINVLAKIRFDIENKNDHKLLKIFKRYRIRNYFSLLVAIKVSGLKQDKNYKKEIKRLKTEFKKVYAKTMPISDSSYSYFLKDLKIKD